jgi:tetratricopeptide (TPR) repeat protein/predicted Ser/Thr protein kinase
VTPSKPDDVNVHASPCPDENALNAFAERHLSSEERAALERHLDGCSDCLEIVSHVARGMAGGAEQATRTERPVSQTTESDAPQRSDEVLVAGQSVGRYRVVEILGQGGMGTVYRAHDPQLDRWVALKVLRFDGAAPGPRARMTREARLMAKLDHPNIVTVFDAGDAEGRTYIAMELVVGTTLSVWLRAAERTVEEVLAVFLVAGRALAAAHHTGVVHRDFKPENVLIDERGRVAVTDFGIAVTSDPMIVSRKLAVDAVDGVDERTGAVGGATLGSSFTRTGMVLGTPGYMSPEQYAGERVEAASDQFSFAVAVYEALFREPPFAGTTLAERRDAVLAGRLLPLSATARSRVKPAVQATLVRALARDPAERFPGMVDLLAGLDDPASRTSGPRSRRLVTGALVLVVAGVALAAGVRGWRAGAPRAIAAAPSAPAASPRFPVSPLAPRAAVVIFPFDNRTGDPRLDGVVDPLMTVLLTSSRRLDGYDARTFRAVHKDLLVPEPGADAGEIDDVLGRMLHLKEDRRVIGVRGELALIGEAGTELAASLVARDLATGRTLVELRETARGVDDLVPTMRALLAQLRGALGDAVDTSDAGAAQGQGALTSSLDALHEWAVGKSLNNSGRYREAKEHLGRAVTLDPDFGEAHAALATTDENLLLVGDASKETLLALKSSDRMGERQRLLVMAAYYSAAARPSEAIGAYEQLLSIWPGDLTTQVNVAATALESQQWTLGLELARRAVADHPYSSVAQSNLLLALVATGHFTEAESTGDALLRDDTTLPPFAYAFVALAHALEGDWQGALDVYARLAPLDAAYADEGRTDLALYEGRLDDAVALARPQLEKALARGDTSAGEDQYQGLSIALLRKGDAGGAARMARGAIGNDSGVPFLYGLARTLVESGNEHEVVAFGGKWGESRAPSARACGKLLLGDIALHHGRTAEALEDYQAALALEDSWQAHERLGTAHLAAKRWELAEADFRACLDRRGEAAVVGTPSLQFLVPVEYGLARALEGRGDPSAIAAYRSFLRRRTGAQGDRLVRDAEQRLAALTAAR